VVLCSRGSVDQHRPTLDRALAGRACLGGAAGDQKGVETQALVLAPGL
jgi:hypothetical protein